VYKVQINVIIQSKNPFYNHAQTPTRDNILLRNRKVEQLNWERMTNKTSWRCELFDLNINF
jgi:hypothetical protein